MKNKQNWQSFIKELSNLLFFWFFIIFFFSIFRFFFIYFFKNQISNSINNSEYIKTFFMGFRFDCTVSGYFLLIPFLLLLSSLYKDVFLNIAKKTRIVSQYLFAFLSTIICIVTINYFKEYNDQFNNFLFLALYDDKKAVIKTIAEDYNPFFNLFIGLITILISIYILRKFENKTKIYNFLITFKSKKAKILLLILVVILFISNIRGTFLSVPAIRKWAGVSKDSFLNKTIINPFRSLKYAIDDFNEVNIIDGDNPFIKNKKLKEYYPNLDYIKLTQKISKGSTIKKPKQIFLVVMESYDSWPLMDKYSALGVSNNLTYIAKNGIHFNHFLPAAKTTFDSFATVVTGVPYCGVNVSRIGNINDPSICSIFNQFKKLGYQTNVFYGGFLTWENIGEFCKYQGADRIFSGADVGGKSDSGNWGVEDEKIFDLILKKTNPNVPSINIILTSSYHPPYSVDVYKKGFKYKSNDDLAKKILPYFDNGMTFEELGHLWYSDLAIGKFVKSAKNKYKESIFCFTGDHYGRRFINHNPNLYERSSVPFIIYGNSINKQVNTTPGTHADIIPTLVELIAPKNFKYYSFGKSLFDKSKTESISYNKMIEKNELFNFPKDAKIEKINLLNFNELKIEKSSFKKNHDLFMGLSWQYTINGNKKIQDKK